MGRRPEQKTVGRAITVKGMKQASINERFSAPGLVGRLPGEPTGRESQAGTARLEGTHSKTACKTTQQHYSATRETCYERGKNNKKIKNKSKTSKYKYLNLN